MIRADSATPARQRASAMICSRGPYSPGQTPNRWPGTCSASGGSTISTSPEVWPGSGAQVEPEDVGRPVHQPR